jgi:hypothetical protein
MNLASPNVAAFQRPTSRWLISLVSGIRWGSEMQRRYASERAAGRRPDAEAIGRMAGEVDAWLGRRI